ncbi:MAG: transglutaminase family protein [Gemmatimonadetes bacterium]|nr:transglutaminase family protein [Gemmatimonadota bacterium]NNM06558.1 transglutaminase family protein [Gemmatimonadota bacterium]
MDDYLKPGHFIDSDHPEVIRFSHRVAGEAPASIHGVPEKADFGRFEGDSGGFEGGLTGSREKAIALYYAVRDEFRYEPYHIDLNEDAMKASALLSRGYGFCIAKAVLMAAAARVQRIPARLGFADVRNHLTTERLRKSMGTDVFVFHGYAELLIDGSWVKATPAFNKALCERFGVETLEFDGIHDSVFQPFDAEGNQYMEYLHDRGVHTDLPLEELREAFETAYPKLMSGGVCDLSGRFDEDGYADRRRRLRERRR